MENSLGQQYVRKGPGACVIWGIFQGICEYPAGPIHLSVCGKKGESGTVICEQIKAIDPKARGCNRVDLLAYEDIMNVSDAVQGIFEYD